MAYTDKASVMSEQAITVKTQDSTTCHLLTIPPEVRNRIYEYTFTCTNPPDVELLTAKPPEKALATTCRQIYEEAKLMYRAQYRAFWSETNFTISLFRNTDNDCIDATQQVISMVRKMDKSDIAHIVNVRISGFIGGMPQTRIRDWIFKDGMWLPGAGLGPANLYCFVTRPQYAQIRPQPCVCVDHDDTGSFAQHVYHYRSEFSANWDIMKAGQGTGLVKDGLLAVVRLVGKLQVG